MTGYDIASAYQGLERMIYQFGYKEARTRRRPWLIFICSNSYVGSQHYTQGVRDGFRMELVLNPQIENEPGVKTLKELGIIE
jgi:hypothetical protein